MKSTYLKLMLGLSILLMHFNAFGFSQSTNIIPSTSFAHGGGSSPAATYTYGMGSNSMQNACWNATETKGFKRTDNSSCLPGYSAQLISIDRSNGNVYSDNAMSFNSTFGYQHTYPQYLYMTFSWIIYCVPSSSATSPPPAYVATTCVTAANGC